MKTSFPILPPLVKRLEELGFHTPTSIQNHAWKNLIAKHQDYVGQAHTGSGKTIAYTIPLLQRIDPKEKIIQAIILVPTRELVNQTAKTIFKLTKNLPTIFVEGILGGEQIELQKQRLKRPTHIVVATPGRLLELLQLKALTIDRVKTIVLDEADELYAKGFMKEIDKILSYTNDFHKTWLFSATIHGDLNTWVRKNLAADTPKAVVATNKVINPKISHHYRTCIKEEKTAFLLEFLAEQKENRGIIFCRTKGDVQYVTRFLQTNDYKVAELFGEMTLKEREKMLRMFHQKAFQYVVASDMAARGIDFEDLAFVFHYQLPDDPDYYTHRSGRTARAGKSGLSMSLVEPVENKKLRYIQDLLSVDFVQV